MWSPKWTTKCIKRNWMPNGRKSMGVQGQDPNLLSVQVQVHHLHRPQSPHLCCSKISTHLHLPNNMKTLLPLPNLIEEVSENNLRLFRIYFNPEKNKFLLVFRNGYFFFLELKEQPKKKKYLNLFSKREIKKK